MTFAVVRTACVRSFCLTVGDIILSRSSQFHISVYRIHDWNRILINCLLSCCDHLNKKDS